MYHKIIVEYFAKSEVKEAIIQERISEFVTHKVNFNYRCLHGCASEHRYLDWKKASSYASLTLIHQTPRIEKNLLAAILFKHFLGANFSFSYFA